MIKANLTRDISLMHLVHDMRNLARSLEKDNHLDGEELTIVRRNCLDACNTCGLDKELRDGECASCRDLNQADWAPVGAKE